MPYCDKINILVPGGESFAWVDSVLEVLANTRKIPFFIRNMKKGTCSDQVSRLLHDRKFQINSYLIFLKSVSKSMWINPKSF